MVVNIKGIKGLEYIKNGKGDVRIGALTPLSSIEESKLIKEKFPGLAKAAGAVGAPAQKCRHHWRQHLPEHQVLVLQPVSVFQEVQACLLQVWK